MRRVNLRNVVAVAPAGAHVEVVHDANKANSANTQYLPLTALGAAPEAGYVTPSVPTGANQALSGTGALAAIDLGSALTTVSTTGAATSTLAAGTQAGQQKTIRMIADVGDMVITVTGDAVVSITLNDVGDVITVMWSGTGWIVADNFGCVTA